MSALVRDLNHSLSQTPPLNISPQPLKEVLKYFTGDNISEWLQYFGFGQEDQDFLLKEIEVQTVDDLNYVYDDEILLNLAKERLSRGFYDVFLKAREKTEILRAALKRKYEELNGRKLSIEEVGKSGINPEEMLITTPINSNINHTMDLSHHKHAVEELTRRNTELETQLRIRDERYKSLETKYQKMKFEVKKYKEQTIYLTKDIEHERQKASQLYKDLQKVNKEKSMLDGNGNECMICCDHIKNTVFLPCMHIAICYDCHKELGLSACPICRVNIEDAKVVYW